MHKMSILKQVGILLSGLVMFRLSQRVFNLKKAVFIQN